jgi:MFS family permease
MPNEMTIIQESVATTHTSSEAKSNSSQLISFGICFVSTLFGGVVTMLMSVYLPVAVRDLLGKVTDDRLNEVSAYINSVFIFGWMIGGIVWGLICDKIGRSKSIVFSTACYGLFTLFTAASPSWLLVSICRFFSGFGIGGVLVTTTILISEIYPEKKRAIAQGILSVAIPVGFFVSGTINNLFSDWRHAFLIGATPLSLAILSAFILQESPQWKAKSNSDKQKENFKQIFEKGNKKNLLTGSVIFGSMLIGLWAIFSWAPTWAQHIAPIGDEQQKRGLTVMILAAGGLSGSFFSGWIVNAIGLRRTMLACFSVCFLFTFLLFKLNLSFSLITYVEMIVLAFFFGISQGALAVYIPEIFVTPIRASATGFCFNVGRLFTGLVVFFIGALVTFLGGYGNAIFVFSFIFLIGLTTVFFSKEN